MKNFKLTIKAEVGDSVADEVVERLTKRRLQDELRSGVQTIQYQINTLMTTNGQSPFVTIFLNLQADDEYLEENAMIVEEILRQRLEGIKNDKGVFVTPAFPKLVYVLDEHNCLKGGKYDYITKLAVKCSAKRLYPDYISAKKMRENYEGNVFAPMGCRSFFWLPGRMTKAITNSRPFQSGCRIFEFASGGYFGTWRRRKILAIAG